MRSSGKNKSLGAQAPGHKGVDMKLREMNLITLAVALENFCRNEIEEESIEKDTELGNKMIALIQKELGTDSKALFKTTSIVLAVATALVDTIDDQVNEVEEQKDKYKKDNSWADECLNTGIKH